MYCIYVKLAFGHEMSGYSERWCWTVEHCPTQSFKVYCGMIVATQQFGNILVPGTFKM